MNAAKAILSMLEAYGVTDVFGLPGETTLSMYAAWEEFPGITYHLCRDERSSVFMADGYAKASGRAGICEGPSVGAPHMIAGAAEAFAACVPMILFTSDVALDTTKKNMLTGCDQTSIFQGVTKDTFTVTKASEIPFLIRRAFRGATSGRPGPVHIRIPQDIYAGEVPDDDVYGQPEYGRFPGVRSGADRVSVSKAAAFIAESKKPVIICGQGSMHSGAWDAVKTLAERENILVGSTINAKGIFSETHKLSIGVVGARGGREWANNLVLEADLIIFAGSSTDSAGTDGWKLPDAKTAAKIIQIDVSEKELGNNYKVLPLLGDARETLELIVSALPVSGASSRTEWVKRANGIRDEFEKKLAVFETSLEDKVHPFVVSRILERVLPDDGFLAVDPGISAVYPAAFTRLAKAGRRTAYNFAMGALGYAIPCAIGARAGVPSGIPVVGLIGDGSFGFAAGELETAARDKLDITYILFDNRTFGWIRGTVFVSRKGSIPSHYNKFTDFAPVDYLKIAEGFGLKAYATDSSKEFERILKESISSPGPKFIVLRMAPEDEMLPPVPGWYKYAKNAGMENLFGSDGIPGKV